MRIQGAIEQAPDSFVHHPLVILPWLAAQSSCFKQKLGCASTSQHFEKTLETLMSLSYMHGEA